MRPATPIPGEYDYPDPQPDTDYEMEAMSARAIASTIWPKGNTE